MLFRNALEIQNDRVSFFLFGRPGSLRSPSGYPLYSLRSCRSYPYRNRAPERYRHIPCCCGRGGYPFTTGGSLTALPAATDTGSPGGLPLAGNIITACHRHIVGTPPGVQEPVEPECPNVIIARRQVCGDGLHARAIPLPTMGDNGIPTAAL